MKPSIEIQPVARRHHKFLLFVGCALLTLSLFISFLFWQQFQLQLIAINLIALVIIITGFVKRLQPKASYLLTPKSFRYNHPWGSLIIEWQYMLDINVVKIETDNIQLPYIGIKLTSIDALASTIAPRLANKLIHEQKELAALAVTYQLLNIQQAVINFEPFKHEKQIFKGPTAAFLHRTQALKQAYGFHLYLPADSFDRDIMAFVSLLKRCKAHRHQYQQN